MVLAQFRKEGPATQEENTPAVICSAAGLLRLWQQIVSCQIDLVCYVEGRMAVEASTICEWYDPILEQWDYCTAGTQYMCGTC